MLYRLSVGSSRESIASIGTDDGGLRLWDARSGRLTAHYPSMLSASVKFTSMAYFAGNDANGKGRGAGAGAGALVALGSSSGKIVVWDLQTAAVLQRIEAHGRSVTDICFTSDGQRLLSGSQDGMICEWNVGDKRKISAINTNAPVSKLALSADDSLLVAASSTITVYDMGSKMAVAEFIGHTSAVQHLVFSWDGKHCASCAEDRTVNIWSVSGSSSKKKKKTTQAKTKQGPAAAVASLSSSASPIYLCFQRSVQGGFSAPGAYNLAVCTAANAVEVYRIPISSSATSKRQVITSASCVVAAQDSKRSQSANNKAREDKHQASTRKTHVYDPHVSQHADGNVVECAFVDNTLFVLRGSFVQPVMQVVQCFDKKKKFVSAELPGLDKAYLFGAKDSLGKKRKAEVADVISPFSSEYAPVDKKSKTTEYAAQAVSFASSTSSSSSVQTPSQSTSSPAVPTSGSVHTLLSQAVHSSDSNLVEFCISRTGNNLKMLEDTVRRLPAQYVVSLLSMLIQKFRNKPSRGPMLFTWIRTVLKVHTAFLISQPQLSKELEPLYHTIDVRLSAFSGFLKLQGRLDFLMTQLDQTAREHSAPSQAASAAPKSMNVFNENDGDSEDESSGSESGHSMDDSEDDSADQWSSEE
jgi:U3 small nucleolar RNA-associated protein 5